MKTVEHLTKEQLAAYAADSLAQIESSAVEKHLLQCPACREALPVPTPEQFWSALLEDEPEREEIYGGANLSPAASPLSAVFAFFRQPAFLGACALILIAALSLLIWRGGSASHQSKTELAQTNQAPKNAKTPNRESNLPTIEKSPDAPGDEAQKIENPQNSKRQPLPRLIKPDANLPQSKGNLSEASETQNRELAQLLENVPPAVSSLRPSQEMILRGKVDKPNSKLAAPAFSLLAPVGETVLETVPEFRWQKIPNATSYRISVLDAEFNEVATAEVSGTSFKLDKPLNRGAKYLWRVAAQTASGEIVAPFPPQPPAVFRVAREKTENQIESLKKNENNRLKLAVFYAQEGMLDAAACALKEILAKNPKHKAARCLLAQVERWKKENNATVQRCGPSTATKADQ
ncbi:MAG: zf-HC2 domain-containing protein [Pyrinomonadaceae bacterium]|nr:zf-HC2 domain-containing protein [Pyrinomonadaceae bacterium]